MTTCQFENSRLQFEIFKLFSAVFDRESRHGPKSLKTVVLVALYVVKMTLKKETSRSAYSCLPNTSNVTAIYLG